jgi:hypothetical protein
MKEGIKEKNGDREGVGFDSDMVMNHPLPEDVWLDLRSIIAHSKHRQDFGGLSAAVSYLWSLISSIHTPLFGALELLQTLYFLKSPGFSWATTCS